MLGLKVKEKTLSLAVKIYRNDDGSFGYKHKQILTKKDHVFIREDIILDPIGNLTDDSKENGGIVTLAFLFGNQPVYGFRELDFDTGVRSDWVLLVPVKDVETG